MMHGATWFFTGTFANQTHEYVASKEEVQRFLKRLRVRAARKDKGRIRYLMLPELHKSGAIHYHGLIHHDGDITYRMVRDSWTAGFSYPSAVKSAMGTARYVTKYCTKSLMGADLDETGRSRRPRILASRNPTYGGPVIIRDADMVKAIQQTKSKDITAIWQQNLKMAMVELEKAKAGPQTVQRRIMELRAGLLPM
jgi:uncharacterized protein (UPF0216 family)